MTYSTLTILNFPIIFVPGQSHHSVALCLSLSRFPPRRKRVSAAKPAGRFFGCAEFAYVPPNPSAYFELALSFGPSLSDRVVRLTVALFFREQAIEMQSRKIEKKIMRLSAA